MTYDNPRRYLIVATIRSGGTLLSHLLDSHPLVHCHRGEPMHKHSNERLVADLPPRGALRTALSPRGYAAVVAKATYSQLRHLQPFADFWQRDDGVEWAGIIHLWRENPLRVIVSEAIRKRDQAHDQHAHTFVAREKRTVTLNPTDTGNEVRRYLDQNADMTARLDRVGVPVLSVTYEAFTHRMVAAPQYSYTSDTVNERLCEFVGVPYYPLASALVRRNPYPLKDIITNYDDVYAACAARGVAQYVTED